MARKRLILLYNGNGKDKTAEPLNIIITGCDASEKLIDLEDLGMEMKEIKHPFNKGVKAMKGIEY